MPVDETPRFQRPQFETPETLLATTTDATGRRTIRDIEVALVPGYRPIRMDLMLPTGTGPVPVVVCIHGGAFMAGSRRFGPAFPELWTALLDKGIAAASLEYRLSGEARFPALLHDVKAAVRWLRRFGPELGVRADAIGAWGESAGGFLSAFLGLNNTDPLLNGEIGVTGVSSDVQVAVAWYPPTEFSTMDLDAPDDALMVHDAADSPESLLIGGALQENQEAAAFASPVRHVGPGAAPMLLIHGLADRVVPHPQSVRLHDALRAAGTDVELRLIPGADHVFMGVDIAPIIAETVQFLAERL